MTEEEKIFAGKLFDARSRELKDLKHHAHEWCRTFNAMNEYDPERLPIIQKFIGSIGRNYYFQGPIQFNYGCHTFIGDNFFANFNLLVMDDGKILMVTQYRNALERDTLEIPAGKLDAPGEPGIECASRELEEETGYRSEDLEWLITLRTTVAFCDEKIDIYVAKNLIPSHQYLDEDEFINVGAYTIDELRKKIYSGEIEDSKTVAALLAYADKYGK